MQTPFPYTKKTKKSLLILIWILFSMITGFSVSAICTTGGNLNTFYDRGDFLPFYSYAGIAADALNIATNSQNLSYDPSTDCFSVSADVAQIYFNSLSANNAWKYMDVFVSDLTQDTLSLSFQYFKKSKTLVGEEIFVLEEGDNILEINSEPFSYAIAYVDAPVGTSFRFEHFRFCTNLPVSESESILWSGILCSMMCFLLIFVVYHILQKRRISPNWYAPVRYLQSFYMFIGSSFENRLHSLSSAAKRIFRILIMTDMFIVLSFINVYNLYFDETAHRYLMLLFLICLLLLALLYIEKDLKPQNWENPLVLSWFFFWLMACISDFIVTKESSYFAFYGYFTLIVVGFLFFVWSNMHDPSIIWEELCKVLEITFFLCTVYCLLFRPESVGFRYKGFYNNPNPFGLYLAIVGCAFFCDLTCCLKRRAIHFGKFAIYCIGLSALVFFLFKTQSATAVLSFVFMGVCWLIENMRFVNSRRHKKRILIMLFTVVLCYLPVSSGLQWGITNLPHLLNTTVSYPGEVEYAKTDMTLPSASITVYAAETDDIPSYSNRLLEKLTSFGTLDTLLSGRMEHYSTYLRSMNLFGHAKRPIVYGNTSNYAHNGFLSCAHTYGVYVLIPYIIMLLYYFYYAVRYLYHSHPDNGFSCFPFSIFIVFFLENLMDNVDTPFHWIVWFIFVFVGGTLFPASNLKRAAQKKTDNDNS